MPFIVDHLNGTRMGSTDFIGDSNILPSRILDVEDVRDKADKCDAVGVPGSAAGFETDGMLDVDGARV